MGQRYKKYEECLEAIASLTGKPKDVIERDIEIKMAREGIANKMAATYLYAVRDLKLPPDKFVETTIRTKEYEIKTLADALAQENGEMSLRGYYLDATERNIEGRKPRMTVRLLDESGIGRISLYGEETIGAFKALGIKPFMPILFLGAHVYRTRFNKILAFILNERKEIRALKPGEMGLPKIEDITKNGWIEVDGRIIMRGYAVRTIDRRYIGCSVCAKKAPNGISIGQKFTCPACKGLAEATELSWRGLGVIVGEDLEDKEVVYSPLRGDAGFNPNDYICKEVLVFGVLDRDGRIRPLSISALSGKDEERRKLAESALALLILKGKEMGKGLYEYNSFLSELKNYLSSIGSSESPEAIIEELRRVKGVQYDPSANWIRYGPS